MINNYGELEDNYQKYRSIKSILKYGIEPQYIPDLSVVIPTYRRHKFLKQALESTIQDFGNLRVEIIVVENDCYDLKDSEMEEILKEFDPTIVRYYQNTENIGMFGNWNRCIELAKAPWIAMLHDDDLIVQNYYKKVEVILNKTKRYPNLVLIKANSASIKNNNIIGRTGIRRIIDKFDTKFFQVGKFSMDLLGPEYIGVFGACSCGSLMKKDVYIECGGFDERHYPSADAQYPAKLVYLYGKKIALTFGILGYYRWEDNDSYSEKVMLGWANEYLQYSKYYSNRSFLSKLRYNFFKDEMMENQKNYILSCLRDSKQVINKEELYSRINQILPSKDRKIRKLLYRLTFSVYWKLKKLPALLFS